METAWTGTAKLEERTNFEWKLCTWSQYFIFYFWDEPFSEKLDQRSGPMIEIFESSS